MASEIQLSNDLVISSLGCAFHASSGTLIIADLHVGYEASLEDEGFAMPRIQTDEMITRFMMAVDRFDPTIVMVNGDLKHSFDRNLRAEWKEVDRILDVLEGTAKPVIIRGNHDNFLATMLARRDIQLKKELIIEDMKISHGHETDSPWDGVMILAHEHPALRLREATGAAVKIPCFLHDPIEHRLILPAFSPMAIGSDIIRKPDDKRMIPLLRRTGTDKYIAYGIATGELLNYKTIGELRRIGDL